MAKPVIHEVWQMAGTDPKEANSWEDPNHLVAQAIAAPALTDGKANIEPAAAVVHGADHTRRIGSARRACLTQPNSSFQAASGA